MSYILNLCFAHGHVYAPQSARVSRKIMEGMKILVELYHKDVFARIVVFNYTRTEQVFLDSITKLDAMFGKVAFI